MSGVEFITVTKDEDGMRLDRWFKTHYPDLKHGQLNKLLRKGNIRLDKKRAKSDTRIQAGQSVRIPPMDTISVFDQPKTLNKKDEYFIKDHLLFEDSDLFILNKPAGIAVQGGTKSNHRNLDDLVSAYFVKSDTKPRLVHRLDKGTSGVLIFAKSRKSAQSLTKQFREKDTQKTYLALSSGKPDQLSGTIDNHLLKRTDRVVIDPKGKKATSEYEVLDHAGRDVSLIKVLPLTGRTHQIRVHLSDSLRTPILGDKKYNKEDAKSFESGNLYLHAWKIQFIHPRTGRIKTIVSPIPKHFLEAFSFLGFTDII